MESLLCFNDCEITGVSYTDEGITIFVSKSAGGNDTFETYFHSPNGKPYEVEHIWAGKFDEHIDEFRQKMDFDEYRNRLGGLVLVPRGTNQSYGEDDLCTFICKRPCTESLLVLKFFHGKL